MASIRDVAEKASVAACTVSRVINGSGYVSDKTREKIEKAMEELDYIPNELARGMFRQKSGIVAMLVPSIKHPFFSSLANSIEKELYQKGYKMMLCSTGDSIEREREYMQIFKSNIVDGVIMGVNNLENQVYEQFQKPLVMLDYFVNDKIPVVVSNHAQGGEFAAERFIKSNCKNIIHVCSINSSNVLSFESHSALEEELKKNGIRSRAVEIKWNDFDFDGYLEMARLILEKNPDIDGIMAADLPAVAFLKAALSLGKKVPDDFCVVAIDGTFIINANILEVTTIIQPIKEIAKKSIEMMTKMIDGHLPTETMCKLDVILKSGNTTG